MFAPPPASCLPTSEARARVEAAKETLRRTESAGSGDSRTSSPKSASERGSSPLSRMDSNGSRQSRTRSSRLFSKNNRRKELHIGSPIPPQANNNFEPHSLAIDGRSPSTTPLSNASKVLELQGRTRQAIALPPKRPPRPDASLLPPPVPRPVWSSASVSRAESPPAAPLVSVAERVQVEHPAPLPPPMQEPVFSEAVLHQALADLRLSPPLPPKRPLPQVPVASQPANKARSQQPARPSTAPPRVEYVISAIQKPLPPRRVSSAHAAKVHGHNVANTGIKDEVQARSRAEVSWNRSTDTCANIAEAVPIPTRLRRPRQTTTMAQTISSLFSVGSPATSSRTTPEVPSSRLSLSDKELPDAPADITDTPLELLHTPFGRVRVGGKRQRSYAAGYSASSNSHYSPQLNSVSKHRTECAERRRLSIIAESILTELTPPASGVSTPKPTSIRLREGSVVTIAPPECSAWTRTFYIHGPIKLLKPTMLPRRNTVASLDLLQNALDAVSSDVYRRRRRSDDRVTDDICDWYAEYDFGEIGYSGDELAGDDEKSKEDDADSERSHTPPLLPEPSTFDVREKSHNLLEPFPESKPLPLQTEEALRARGIARVTKLKARPHSRVDSHTLSPTDVAATGIPHSGSVLHTISDASDGERDMLVSDSRFDWDEDDGNDSDAAPWTSSGWSKVNELNRIQSDRANKSPVAKMSRLMATARTML